MLKTILISKIETTRESNAMAMVFASAFLKLSRIFFLVATLITVTMGGAFAANVPSITSMQRRVTPRASDRIANQEKLLPPTFCFPPMVPPHKKSEQEPKLLPPLPPFRKSQRLPSTIKRAPEPKRLPAPVFAPLQPIRLPDNKAGSEAASLEFERWQPPGIYSPKVDSGAEKTIDNRGMIFDSEMILDDNVDHSKPSPLSTIRMPISEVMQVAHWEDSAGTSVSNASTLSLVDRSVCPAMNWAHADDFSATPLPVDPWFHDADSEQTVYDDKQPVPTQRPWIEWGRKFYGSGITPPSETWLGDTNLVQQQLYLYGDYRTGISTGRNDLARIDNWASRLNLDLDYRITATERFHAFFGPLNRATQFTRLERVDGDWEYQTFYNLNPVTAYFEGDAGALLGGAAGTPSPFELPVTAGLVPLVFQNGIWLEDAASGFAFAIPARHSRLLNWANFDATFFAVFDQINSPAFGADKHAAQAFGTALFIDAYDGYIETGYAYLNDREGLGRSYHNATASYTRRYFDRISNSIRLITNMGQDLPKADRTADGALLLIENSLVTNEPLTVVPYFNLFAGWGRPQSVARAGVAGGVLRNTGINFEIDGLNGYPTLDATGADTAGGSIGVDLIGDDLDRQWLLEASYVTAHGDRALISGDQFALGTRYQVAISHRSIIRFDTMYGWEKGDNNINGSRIEYRWKF